MRLFRFGCMGEERPGLLDGKGIARDVSSIIRDWESSALCTASLAELAAADLHMFPRVPSGTRLGSCVAMPSNFLAVGLNYLDHAKEARMELPAEPVVFNKAPSCLSGPNDPIQIPHGAESVDWEVELAVVIGEYTYCVDEQTARQHIAGYCVCNDVSERSWQLKGTGQWTKGKSAPTFGPLGPWLVTPDEILDPLELQMFLDVNGERKQEGSTRSMVFPPAFLVSYISKFMALLPGDIVTTGTPPGVGMASNTYLNDGDVVRLGISGLGAQCQNVICAE